MQTYGEDTIRGAAPQGWVVTPGTLPEVVACDRSA